MAAATQIEWTDHTFNPWVGCMKVSPLCDNCYAADLVTSKKWFTPDPKSQARADAASYQWGEPGVGVGHRKRTAESTWKQPLAWNRKAQREGTRPFVFCASLADVFDNAVDPTWRTDLFDLIRATPNLIWLLLTKRPQNIERMVAANGGLPPNVALGTSAGTQPEANKAIALIARAKINLRPAFTFISAEPLLEPVSFMATPDLRVAMTQVDWVIVGGESGRGARQMDLDWARSIRDELAPTQTVFNFKQTGGWPGSGKGSHELDGRTHFGRPVGFASVPSASAQSTMMPARSLVQYRPLAIRYTLEEARIEKDRIEKDYLVGLISSDKKRGQKMLVTRRTEGRV